MEDDTDGMHCEQHRGRWIAGGILFIMLMITLAFLIDGGRMGGIHEATGTLGESLNAVYTYATG